MNDKSTPTSNPRLLERLRSPLGNFEHPHEANQRRAQSLCTEAATEIERLQTDNERLMHHVRASPSLSNAYVNLAETEIDAQRRRANALQDEVRALKSSAHETTEPKPVAWRWIVDSPFEPRIRWGFSESKVEGVNAEPLYLRPSPEEPDATRDPVRDSIAPNKRCPKCQRFFWLDQFDGHDCKPLKAAPRRLPLPDHLKAPVKAGDQCPAIDDVHTEHQGKCVYCGAPMPQVKASEPTFQTPQFAGLAFRHWSKDPLVPYKGCQCDTCLADK